MTASKILNALTKALDSDEVAVEKESHQSMEKKQPVVEERKISDEKKAVEESIENNDDDDAAAATKGKFSSYEAQYYSDAVNAFAKQDNYQMAAENLQKVIDAKEEQLKNGFSHELAYDYYQMGLLTNINGDKKSSSSFFNRAMECIKQNLTKEMDFKTLDIIYDLINTYGTFSNQATQEEYIRKTAGLIKGNKQNPLAAVLLRGALLLTQEQHKKALELYEKTLKFYPKHPVVYKYQSIASWLNEDYEQALHSIDKAIESHAPGYASAYNWKGNICEALYDNKAAIQAHSKAIELEPKLASAWADKAFLAYEMDDQTIAFECLEKALELNPTEDYYHYKMGTYMLKKFDLGKAVRHFIVATSLKETDADYWAGLAECEMLLDNCKDALTAVENAIALDEGNAGFMALKGKIYMADGDKKNAISAFNDAIEMEPKNKEFKKLKNKCFD
jgi:tetratricopeptide (TPR) repeat protein